MRHLPTYLLASLTLLGGVAILSAAGAQESDAQDPTQAKPQSLADQLAESNDAEPALAPEPTADESQAATPAPAATEPQPAAATKTETQPLAMPAASATGEVAAPVVTPSRGATMAAVREKFGAPAQEAAGVGTPPISRWEYTSYVVYFENDRVLHTVVK